MSNPSSRQDSPMVDEMFDGTQMDIGEAEVDDTMTVETMQQHLNTAISDGSSGPVGAGAGGSGGTTAVGLIQLGNSSMVAAGTSQNQPSCLLAELTYRDRTVHADFHKHFGDLYDDKDLD